jgi:hypothetical protein
VENIQSNFNPIIIIMLENIGDISPKYESIELFHCECFRTIGNNVSDISKIKSLMFLK